jgi:hypothetical protein
VNGLKAQFGDRVDFIALNVDVMETMLIRERFNLVQRSQYALIDPVGTILQQWYGFLDEASVAQSISDYLGTIG